MTRRFAVFAISSALFVPLVLLLDGEGWLRQCALGVATAAFVAYFVRLLEVPPRQILCAIAVATVGELILSVALGVYEYRYAVLPLYVPAGHGLFYLLAVTTAQRLRNERIIVRTTAVLGTIAAIAALIVQRDELGFLWWVAAAVILLRSRHGLVISMCIYYTSALEYLGTALGNWHWTPIVPFLGIRAANPPVGVGILYITLDVTVIALTAAISSWRPVSWGRSADREGLYQP